MKMAMNTVQKMKSMKNFLMNRWSAENLKEMRDGLCLIISERRYMIVVGCVQMSLKASLAYRLIIP